MQTCATKANATKANATHAHAHAHTDVPMTTPVIGARNGALHQQVASTLVWMRRTLEALGAWARALMGEKAEVDDQFIPVPIPVHRQRAMRF